MASGRTAIVVGAVCFGLGMIVAPDPVPETKVVTVPAPPTVMTKKEVVTKSVLVPLPKSCESLVGSFDQLVNSANRIHNRTREVYRRADAVDGESLVSSEAGYRFEQWLLRSNSAASDDLHAMMEYADNAESGLALCKSDMAKAAADAD